MIQCSEILAHIYPGFAFDSFDQQLQQQRHRAFQEAHQTFRRSGLASCIPRRNQSLVPSQVILFGKTQESTISLGDVGFMLARFPDDVCDVPEPMDIPNHACTPILFLNVQFNGMDYVPVLAESSSADVEAQYKVKFSDQQELRTASGGLAKYWVFVGKVTLGLNTPDLKALAIFIPPSCNSPRATFVNDLYGFPPNSLIPTGIKFDTFPPIIQSVYTTTSAGNYTAGSKIDIIIKFSKNVQLSELPDKYSQVYLNAQATSTMLYGVPYIELNSGVLVALRGYESVQDQSKLSFLYLVGTGEQTPDGLQLDIAANTTIQLNGGSITGSNNGLDADMTTMPSYGQSGALLAVGCKPCSHLLLCIELRLLSRFVRRPLVESMVSVAK